VTILRVAAVCILVGLILLTFILTVDYIYWP